MEAHKQHNHKTALQLFDALILIIQKSTCIAAPIQLHQEEDSQVLVVLCIVVISTIFIWLIIQVELMQDVLDYISTIDAHYI